MAVKITVESPVRPTEDQAKVERALLNIFPSGKIETMRMGHEVVRLQVKGDSLEFLSKFRNLIKQDRIRTAARSIILGRTLGNKIRLFLNKQAAFAGHVSFCEPTGESPLGPLSVEIEADRPETVLDFLASRPGIHSYESSQDER